MLSSLSKDNELEEAQDEDQISVNAIGEAHGTEITFFS
jgi:hypothetical protein